MYLPEGYKSNRVAVILSFSLLIALLIYGVFTNIRNERAFSGETRFTIGTTTRIYFSTSGRVLEYEYKYAGKTYNESSTYAYDAKVPGGKYYIRVSVSDPGLSKIFLNKPVPSHIIESPPEGWAEIPK